MWLFDNCPVPNLKTALPGPRAQSFLERDQRYTSPSYTRVYPLVVERGSGAVIQDVDGNLFLDFTAGIAVTATGHCHPKVVAAIQDQAAKLIHMSGTDFYYEPQIDLAERLAKLAPPAHSTNRVFFTNSGAEALEAALKLARWHTGRTRAVAFLGAFHGRTYGAMSLSGSKVVHRRGFSPLVPDIHHVPYPVGCTSCADAAGCRCVREIEENLLRRTAPPDEVAAIFVEPIQGEGGYRVPPPGFLPALRELCDRHQILLVADEVQSGIGRTGKMFAVEHWGVVPDIVCLAKGIASGMPLGAIIAREEIMDWPPGSHASTFGGNPVSCRAALETLNLVQQQYMASAVERGAQLKAGLLAMHEKFRRIGEVRGLGLMVAMDVVEEDNPQALDPAARDEIIQTAFHRGLLLLGCGESAVRFCPPLCITAKQVDTALEILHDVFADKPASGERKPPVETFNI